MRDQLLGYLLDALEPQEHEQVEAQLKIDPNLQRELDLLSRGLRPLACDKATFDPPPGLAARTCQFVAGYDTKVVLPLREPAASTSRWSFADMVVAAGIFLAASLLFLPAMNQSRFAARVTQCQDHLRQIGVGLHSYSDANNKFFPDVEPDGPLGAVAVVAVRLHDQGFLQGPQILICPASTLADQPHLFRLPSPEQLQAAAGAELRRLHQQMRGSYGFYLGHVANGQYQTPRNAHRPRFALVADAPSSTPPYHSLNHGGCGQNVLFEDMHVSYLTTCKARGCTDNFFVNDEGSVDVGLHPNDAVIVGGDARPVMGKVLIKIRVDKKP
jgi:hypothetical protein